MARPRYEIKYPNGGVTRVVGARNQKEEIFTHEIFGSYNIARMNAVKHLKPLINYQLTDDVIEMAKKRDINPAVINTMTLARAMEPVIMMAVGDGTHSLLDGNHRLVWLMENGAQRFSGYEFTRADADEFAVEFKYRRSKDGFWRTLKPMELIQQAWGKYGDELMHGGGSTC